MTIINETTIVVFTLLD